MDALQTNKTSKSKIKPILFLLIALVLLSITNTKNLDSNDFNTKESISKANENINNLASNNYKIFLTENSLNENEKLFRLIDETRYDAPITSHWNRDLAIAYRDIAGIGYVSNDSATMQINELLKGEKKDERKIGFFFRKFFEIGDWEHVNTFTGEKDINYFSYTILRNKRIGKVIFTFSGTKGVKQLFTEYLNSGMETFFKYDVNQADDSNLNLTKEEILNNLNKLNLNNNNDYDDAPKENSNEASSKKEKDKISFKNFKVMKYFNHIYKSFSDQLTNDAKKAINSEITQYVFVGHSLGGAIASIAAYDLITQGVIQVTKGPIASPVLLTYGQPRTGNYVFANEIAKKIPIIFRHVNNFDAITSIPDCYRSGSGYCENEYAKSKLDFEFSDYDAIKIDESIFKSKSFPWHFNGLILNIDDDNSNECIESSEAAIENDNVYNNNNNNKNPLILLDKETENKKTCAVESKMRIAFHTVYYGFKISDMFKPEIFKYHLTEISCSLEDLLDFDLKIPFFTSIESLSDYLFQKVPLPKEAEDSIDDNFIFLKDEDKKEEIKTVQKKILFSNKQGICYYLLKLFRFFGKFQ